VDVGCGKGAALLVASEFPFRRIVGVEVVASFAAVARENARRARRTVEIVHADAASFDPPSDQLVLYLYNPFAASTLQRLLATLERTLEAQPRSLWFLYFQPDFRELLDRAPFLELVDRSGRLLVYAHVPARGDRASAD